MAPAAPVRAALGVVVVMTRLLPTRAGLAPVAMLTAKPRRMMAVAENYPQLKANQNFQQLQDELTDLENKIAAARRFLNNAVAEYNAAIQQFPEIMECHVLLGNVDFLLRIIVPDVNAYERFFFERLSRLPMVQEVNTMIALSQIKSTTVLPLELVGA